jgi:dTDP-4-amino-4,6-dideoxygalactose transaminase
MRNPVRFSYLSQQFADVDELWAELRAFVRTGDFTLGKPLGEFEKRFAALMGTRHAVGVNSGTDAIKLLLEALGVGRDDEVITAANTFVATVGAIAELGAKPVFVDCDDSFCMDVAQLEAKITPRTKAVVPVHLTGYMTDMPRLLQIAERHGLAVVEDACQAMLAEIGGRKAGQWGQAGAFSLHPLKILNVWSDGGMAVTDDDELDRRLRLLRNHGLADRDTVLLMGRNSRLDTFQAVVGNWLIPKAAWIVEQRIANARLYDKGLGQIAQVRIPPRPDAMRVSYHLYVVFAESRDELLRFCIGRGIEAKIHYPTPIYRQPGLAFLKHKEGDFPNADRHARDMISLPCDQHLSREEIAIVVDAVREFYAGA